LVEWKEGSADWISLKVLKDSCPVKLAEYSLAINIADEPAITWWINGIMRKRDQIISKVKSHYWKLHISLGYGCPNQ
jgi:hypothetical protein